MNYLERVYDAVLRSGTKYITAAEITKDTGMHKTTVHRNLNILELMGKVENRHGAWRVRAADQTAKSVEKQITIELPIPRDHFQFVTAIDLLAKDAEDEGFPRLVETYRTVLENYNRTRTIVVKGKNVDDLDLEKAATLIQQANEKSSKINLRGLLKNFRRSSGATPKSSET
jgi:hypothetical protein